MDLVFQFKRDMSDVKISAKIDNLKKKSYSEKKKILRRSNWTWNYDMGDECLGGIHDLELQFLDRIGTTRQTIF